MIKLRENDSKTSKLSQIDSQTESNEYLVSNVDKTLREGKHFEEKNIGNRSAECQRREGLSREKIGKKEIIK